MGNKKNSVSMFSKTEKTLLDIGTNSVKILQVEKKGKKIVIKSAEKVENIEKFYKGSEGINIEALVEEIESKSNMKKLKKKKIEIAYSNKKMQAKIVTIKEGKEKELQEQVKAEIEKNFGQTMEEGGYVTDFCHLGKVFNKEKNEEAVLMILIEEKGVEEYVEALEKKGAIVNDIQPNIVGLSNTLKIIEKNKDSKMIINMGNDSSVILFSIDDVPVYSRTINFGASYLLNKIQMNMKKSKEELEEMMIAIGLGEIEATSAEYGDPFDYGSGKEEEEEDEYKDDYIMAKVNANKEEEEEIVAIIKENFESFIIEIERSMTFVKQNTKFESERLTISGGLANMKGIKEYMKNSLMMEVEVFKAQNYKDENVELELEEELGPEFAILLGVAMRGMI